MNDPILAEKHTGMRVSANGLLGRIADGRRVEKHQRVFCGELLNNLEEMAGRYYSGDASVVDKFLQLWCLDDKRPTESHEDENQATEETLP